MEFLHRFYKLHNLLKSRRQPISRRDIELRLECAPATAKRIIRELRNHDAPIESVRSRPCHRKNDPPWRTSLTSGFLLATPAGGAHWLSGRIEPVARGQPFRSLPERSS